MKPHRTDGVSLTFGLIFLGIVIVWLFNQAVSVNLNAGWIVAIGLIVFGLLGLIGALRSDNPDKPDKPDKANKQARAAKAAKVTSPAGPDPNEPDDYDYDKD